MTRKKMNNMRILIRSNLDVPVERGLVIDDEALQKIVPFVEYAMDGFARIIIASSFDSCTSMKLADDHLKAVADRLGELLPVKRVPACWYNTSLTEDYFSSVKMGQVILMGTNGTEFSPACDFTVDLVHDCHNETEHSAEELDTVLDGDVYSCLAG